MTEIGCVSLQDRSGPVYSIGENHGVATVVVLADMAGLVSDKEVLYVSS